MTEEITIRHAAAEAPSTVPAGDQGITTRRARWH